MSGWAGSGAGGTGSGRCCKANLLGNWRHLLVQIMQNTGKDVISTLRSLRCRFFAYTVHLAARA